MSKVCGKVWTLVKDQDLFGIPVQLTYKGERAFNTVFGGCVSIVIIVSFTALFCVQLHRLYTDPEWLSTPETYTFGN